MKDGVSVEARLEPGSELWAACQADIIRLLKGETVKRGRLSVTRDYRSLDGFEALADALRTVAVSDEAWTDEDSWAAVESLVTAVADDDLSQRGLLAAKIFLGYRATPSEHDLVPMCDAAIAYAKEKREGQLYTLAFIRQDEQAVPKEAPFEDSITVREAFAAPMFSPTSATPSTFHSDRTRTSPHILEVADTLLIALLGHISERTATKATTADDAAAVQPEATGWRQWLGRKVRDYYSEGYPHPNQYWRPIRTGEALVDHLEGKRLRIEYRNRAITREDYDAARQELKRRRRARGY